MTDRSDPFPAVGGGSRDRAVTVVVWAMVVVRVRRTVRLLWVNGLRRTAVSGLGTWDCRTSRIGRNLERGKNMIALLLALGQLVGTGSPSTGV
ncbi:hypothetical protein [Protofrankia symbiont of Coriaria ruscifolia]|uniref:hypothetical protein n=1 Tax=Protofrankia symbiont of Coriaria ruscifolia TaxID=1306542 RepID=UPI00104144CD|nr:hypothetical protein [Protofrankia symbiont of Coriaria ruscifolia]